MMKKTYSMNKVRTGIINTGINSNFNIPNNFISCIVGTVSDLEITPKHLFTYVSSEWQLFKSQKSPFQLSIINTSTFLRPR